MKRLYVVGLLAAVACGGKGSAQPSSTTTTNDWTGPGSGAQQPTNDWAKPRPPDANTNDSWSSTTEVTPKDPLARPLFWSATKNGKTTYLLGTMHMGVDAEARLPAIVWEKLDASKMFAVETDTTDPAVLGMGARTSGTLRGDLGEAYWKKLEAIIDPRLLAGLDKMKPAITVAMLSMRGLPRTPPMDGILLTRANRKQKQIVYLEPATKQAALLDKWLDVRALKSMLDDPEGGLASTKAMLEAYLSGDEAKMIALSNSQKAEQLKQGITEKEYEQSLDEMLYQRNASWIDPIEKMHANGPAFVAVGALHLVGPKSVLELLSHRGYKIQRIKP
jgi:uncharacterized protein